MKIKRLSLQRWMCKPESYPYDYNTHLNLKKQEHSMEKARAPRNRTLTVTDHEREHYKKKLLYPTQEISLNSITNKTICSDIFAIIDNLPNSCVDLLIIDPPYNLDKNFHGVKFSKSNDESYLEYLRSWFPKILKVLKPNGSVYICGDW